MKTILILLVLALAGCSSQPKPVVVIKSPSRGPIGAADEFAAAAFPLETYGLQVIETKGFKK